MPDLEARTYEVTRYPHCDPTEAQLDAAWELYSESFEAAERRGWFDARNAAADGYVVDIHAINVEHMVDDGHLDPRRPEYLVYYDHPEEDRRILVGYMYSTLSDEGEQVAGPLTVWHYHDEIAVPVSRGERLLVDETEYDSLAEAVEAMGGPASLGPYRSDEMIHVWFVRHPEGPFASSMAVPERYLEEPEKMNESAFKRYAMRNYERYFDADG